MFENLYSYESEIQRNIDFQINNPIPNTPIIYDKLFLNSQFKGYVMEYKKGTQTFRESINSDISFDDKINAICDIYQALKYLHERKIYIGDIHSDNFLIGPNGRGYVIDLENIRFPGDEFKFEQCYLIKPNNNQNRINIANAYTDNIKTMISSLTLLLGLDLEKMISKKSHDINLEELNQKIILPLKDNNLTVYIKKLMYSHQNKKVDYFDDFLRMPQNSKKQSNYKIK